MLFIKQAGVATTRLPIKIVAVAHYQTQMNSSSVRFYHLHETTRPLYDCLFIQHGFYFR